MTAKNIAVPASAFRTLRVTDEADMPLAQKIWYLQRSSLFSATPHAYVEGVHGAFTICSFPKKTRIFDFADAAKTIFVVKRGKVRLSRIGTDGKETIFAVLGEGSVFGEDALLINDGNRTAAATAIEDVTLCMSNAGDLQALLENDSRIAMNVARLLHIRLHDAMETIEDLSHARLSERILRLFERLSRRYGKSTGRHTVVDVKLTQADIAALTGASREGVAAELGLLQRQGKMRAANGIFVLVRAALEL